MVKEQELQRGILIHQAKLASMGQMLENISHQWRQPLNRISTFIINMQKHINDKYKEEDYLINTLNQSQLQLEYMSNTINDFTDFNQQAKHKETFLASSVIDSVRTIVDQTLEKNNIQFEMICHQDFSIVSYPRELSQVVLNLIQECTGCIAKKTGRSPCH